MTAPAKLLVVGAAAEDRDALERQLRVDGHAVETAGGCDAAMAKVRADHYDLVMIYASRSGGDSERLVGELRRDTASASIPVIALLATEDVALVSRWLELGVDDYLPRGFTPAILQPRLRAALERR